MAWTLFWDMHSGGNLKEKWSKIYIEAHETEAKTIFYNMFGHNPERITCSCCGADYSITEYESLEEASEFHRNEQPVGEYVNSEDVRVIRCGDIKKSDREGTVPPQGWVWM